MNSKEMSIIEKLFNRYGIEEYEKNTLNCMNHFIDLYITDILKEAKKNMYLSKREKLCLEDVESAVKLKQDNKYKNSSKIQDLKFLSEQVNSKELPQIPESPLVLIPPINNNLLRNNFQIYSHELNDILMENKNLIDNSLKIDDNNILGNKRNLNSINYNRNKLSSKNEKREQKNKRKKSINQDFKNASKENKRNEGMNENNIDNKKINDLEKANGSFGSNSFSNKENDSDSDDDDELDKSKNNGEESSINKKEITEEEESEISGNQDKNVSDYDDVNGNSYSNNNEEDN